MFEHKGDMDEGIFAIKKKCIVRQSVFENLLLEISACGWILGNWCHLDKQTSETLFESNVLTGRSDKSSSVYKLNESVRIMFGLDGYGLIKDTRTEEIWRDNSYSKCEPFFPNCCPIKILFSGPSPFFAKNLLVEKCNF